MTSTIKYPSFTDDCLVNLLKKHGIAYNEYWFDLDQVNVYAYETSDGHGMQVYTDCHKNLSYMHEDGEPFNAWVIIWTGDKIVAETKCYHTHMNGFDLRENDVVTPEPLSAALKEAKKLLKELRASR